MILVTGANGMVGSYVCDTFAQEQKNGLLALTDIPEMDVTDHDKVFRLFDKHQPMVVLHLAAETNVDLCETEVDHAFRVNTMGTQNVALACQRYDAVMVYISTGMVFDGKKDVVKTEFATPSPVNVYSKAKYEGEKIVQGLLDRYFIFRAGWMIGGGKKDKKFVGKMIELCKTKKIVQAVDDKFGSPTFARDFLGGIKKVIQTGQFGLYHLVNSGVVSRYEIAKEIVRIMGVDVEVVPVSSDKFPLPAPRAESEAMRNYKLDLMGINPMPKWEDSLEKYIKEIGG